MYNITFYRRRVPKLYKTGRKPVTGSGYRYLYIYLNCSVDSARAFVLDRKKDGAQYSRRRRASSSAERKCSYEADKQVEYATSTLQRSKRDDSGDKMFMGGGGKSIDYDVCPYATFSVMQTTPSGSRTPAHHRALSQTDCYETPDHNVVHGLPIDKSYGEPTT